MSDEKYDIFPSDFSDEIKNNCQLYDEIKNNCQLYDDKKNSPNESDEKYDVVLVHNYYERMCDGLLNEIKRVEHIVNNDIFLLHGFSNLHFYLESYGKFLNKSDNGKLSHREKIIFKKLENIAYENIHIVYPDIWNYFIQKLFDTIEYIELYNKHNMFDDLLNLPIRRLDLYEYEMYRRKNKLPSIKNMSNLDIFDQLIRIVLTTQNIYLSIYLEMEFPHEKSLKTVIYDYYVSECLKFLDTNREDMTSYDFLPDCDIIELAHTTKHKIICESCHHGNFNEIHLINTKDITIYEKMIN